LPVRLVLADRCGPFAQARSIWGGQATIKVRTVEMVAPARDVTVLALT
jgi:hypothetical protein